MQTTDQPIGFWVKHLDNRIDAAMDRSLSTHALTRRGWLDRAPDGRWSLTDAGRAAQAAAAASVHADRAAAMRGIDEGDYRTAIRVLRMMSDNLAG